MCGTSATFSIALTSSAKCDSYDLDLLDYKRCLEAKAGKHAEATHLNQTSIMSYVKNNLKYQLDAPLSNYQCQDWRLKN